MSVTTATATAAPDDRPRTSSASWVSLSQAAKILGRSTDIVKSVALTGAIKTRSLPGARTVFSLDDCRKLADSEGS
jgi:hypothetical protein